ncbi:uncharacterized protein LOC117175398 [Belonocnema kinseyi]|uniref:uncharacterized protein LOC117175398 n=1 Tax=Belonocnema kinseyi TaxID=2817044 RepID=UPI00143D23F7|nr:uncharacterized protein LOC117175398 [Belonocnema kinseyi]
MPLKEEVNELDESFNMAYKRFLSMERKLNKDSDLKDKYVEFMTDYARQGHMELISQEEIETGKLVNYLPHHAVTKESSTTTKLRMVFDGSARTSSGLSLNEVQRIGYVFQNDLFSITLRFRQHPIVLSADKTQIYRQIRIREDQQYLQRILRRTDPSTPVQHFKLMTLTYGTASAPFLAHCDKSARTIKRNIQALARLLFETSM